jgi:hypothetical protein
MPAAARIPVFLMHLHTIDRVTGTGRVTRQYLTELSQSMPVPEARRPGPGRPPSPD